MLIQIQMQNFKVGKKISDGAFGTVYEAKVLPTQKTKGYPDVVAIKQVYNSTQHLQRELTILKKLPKCKHIIKVYAILTSKFETHIVMQKGKYDLSYWIDKSSYPIPENLIKNIAHQLLEGINIVHSNHIIHRDLKPSNLVIGQNGQLAICDFGSAVECSKGEDYQIQGFTRWYKCPQMLYGSRNYLHQADIWSIGCILMELATGTPLFNGKSQIEQLSLIAKFLGDPSVDNWPSVVKMPDYQKINFKKISPKTPEQIAEEWSVSLPFVNFILKMVKYENRASSKQLLNDQYFKDTVKLQSIGLDTNSICLVQSELVEKAKKEKLI